MAAPSDLVTISFTMEATRTLAIELLASCGVKTGAAPWMSSMDRWTLEVPRWSRWLLAWWASLNPRPVDWRMQLAVRHFETCRECEAALGVLLRMSTTAADEWLQAGMKRGFHARS